MNSQYVILTGSKNNAGDFLIKYRAKELFKKFRPDRKIIDLNSWEDLKEKDLTIINSSQALILLGGPALQKNMYPKIYPLTESLENITVPIITMGIGWKSISGTWESTYNYPITKSTKSLLKKIESNEYQSSVRDFHTLNSLNFHGFNKYLMTGCPAYYALPNIDQPFNFNSSLDKVAFSLGVSFIESPSMEAAMKQQITQLYKYFEGKQFQVVFHHSLDKESYLKTNNAKENHNKMHQRFAKWLDSSNIQHIDISGSAEKLINYYSGIDLHIGYRVHAHIFMNSIAKKSILIAEDGRAKGSQSAIGGMVIHGYQKYKNHIINKLLNRLHRNFDCYSANKNALAEAIYILEYELKTKGYHSKKSNKLINENFQQMITFIKNLP